MKVSNFKQPPTTYSRTVKASKSAEPLIVIGTNNWWIPNKRYSTPASVRLITHHGSTIKCESHSRSRVINDMGSSRVAQTPQTKCRCRAHTIYLLWYRYRSWAGVSVGHCRQWCDCGSGIRHASRRWWPKMLEHMVAACRRFIDHDQDGCQV